MVFYCFIQIGVVNFAPYQDLFMTTYSRSKTSFSAFPLTPSVSAFPHRQFRGSGPNGRAPAVGLKLSDLVQRLQVAENSLTGCKILFKVTSFVKGCYQLTTGGKFAEAVDKFRATLLSIPLLVVESRQEIAEVQQLLQICKEYILGEFNYILIRL